MTRKKSAFVASLMLISLLVYLCGCNKTKANENFEKQVRNGNADKAIEIYKDEMVGNAEYEKGAQQFLNQYLNDSLSQFGKGEIREEDFLTIFNNISTINNDCRILPNLIEATGKYNAIKNSKVYYQQGIEYLENSDYLSAIEVFPKVVADDSEHYSEAQKKLEQARKDYEDSVIKLAEEMINRADHKGAFDYVNSAISSIGKSERLSDYLSGAKKQYKSDVLAKVESLSSEGKYGDTYSLLDEAIRVLGNDSELSEAYDKTSTLEFESRTNSAYESKDFITVFQLHVLAVNNPHISISDKMNSIYDTSIDEYLNDVRSRAETAFGENKDYKTAVQIVSGELAQVADLSITELTQELESLKAYYAAYEPVPLKTANVINSSNYIRTSLPVSDTYSDYYMDVNKRVYDPSCVIHAFSDDWTTHAIEYNLNFEYSKLSGVIYRPYSSLSYPKDGVGAEILIYGDDVLLYETKEITPDMYDAIEFTVDTSGVRNLKIVFKNAVYDYRPKLCISEAMLTK